MGILLRAKLKTMPVMDFEDIGRELWASAGLSSDHTNKIVADHRLEMSEYLRGEFNCVKDAEAYALNEGRWYERLEMVWKWERMDPYLLLYTNNAGGIALGVQFAPMQYIVRTDESTWKAYKVPEALQDFYNDQLQTGG